jgi:hypothetical protein
MRKLLILSLMLGTLGFVVPPAEAKTVAAVSAEPQINVRIGQPRRRWNRRTRTVTSTRIRWIGRYRYRETVRTTYFANGRTRTRVIRRVRLGGRRVYRNY